jgi:hypothetical protein
VADFDPLSGHASLLGSTLSHTLQTLNQGPLQEDQLHDVNAALANVLQPDSPVLVTQCGSLGDPGSGSAHWAQNLGQDSLQRLIAAPHGMAAAIENRLNWLGSSRPNIFKMPFMSQVTGVDNSQILPPYFPAYRGEDVLFGAMLVAMHPLSVAVEYPWSVPHLPVEARNFSMTEKTGSGGGIALFARHLTEGIDYRGAIDPAQRLLALAYEARCMAARSDAELLLDYRAELARGHADQLYVLQSQLSAAKQLYSADWEDYLQARIEEVQHFITTAQSPTAIDGLPADVTEQAVLAQFRELAGGFAAGMSAWVGMREVAAQLTQELVSSRELIPF